MIVSIGVFQLKKRNLLPRFLKLSKKIHLQALVAKGNIKAELSNEGIVSFYSFTHWRKTEDMLQFVHSKKHGEVLKESKNLCKKVSFLHYESKKSVDLSTAIKELSNNSNTREIIY